MTIRVVIVENHLIALRAMSAELEAQPDIDVAATVSGEVGTDDLLRLVGDEEPHVVVLDLSLKYPRLDSFEVIPALKGRQPEVAILALVGRDDGTLLPWLVSHRVKGCMFSDDERTLPLSATVRKVAEGKIVYSHDIMERCFHLLDLRLTQRESEVLCLMGEGLANGEIARRLSTSPVTVRNHLSSIYAKLGIVQGQDRNSRVCAVNAARQLGMLGGEVRR
jgi:DNA-binding NarL/FixJ family response regulator